MKLHSHSHHRRCVLQACGTNIEFQQGRQQFCIACLGRGGRGNVSSTGRYPGMCEQCKQLCAMKDIASMTKKLFHEIALR